MYEYKFVSTSLGGYFTEATHQETIQEHAREGWRLVQVLPTNYNGHGKPTEYEIIFERQVHGGEEQNVIHEDIFRDLRKILDQALRILPNKEGAITDRDELSMDSHAEQDERYEHCPACGAIVNVYTRVCPSCGLTLINAEEGDRPQP